MSARPRLIFTMALCAIVFTGCGLRDPYERQPQPPHTTTTTIATAPQATAGHSAAEVIARFARAWVNWTALTLPSRQHELMMLAAGRLAVELHQDAAQSVRVQLQQAAGAYSRGRLLGTIAQPGGRTIVLTYAQTAPSGSPAQGTYYIYLARTQHTPSGWRLSEWQLASDG